jgi:phytoene dehydrogenase-like protein
MKYDVVIVGAGLAGLACGKTLQQNNLSFIILEADDRPGGRIKTDLVDGYLLDHGFQVLQTGYPEAKKMLDYDALALKKFPSGVAVHRKQKNAIIADPRQHPRYLLSTVASTVGTLSDRLAMLKLSRFVCSGSIEELFEQQEETTIEFLQKWGFSKGFIRSFFVPFFAGTSLDPGIKASSRVLKYIFRVFTQGDAAVPAKGMGEIPGSLAADLPEEAIQYSKKVIKVAKGSVTLADGTVIYGREVVLATSLPALEELLPGALPQASSVGEKCLYYAADWQPPIKEPFLVLNGDGRGPINNMAFPSLVAPEYSSSGKTLIAAVVLGDEMKRDNLERAVRDQCIEWFGRDAENWHHLRTYTIDHALPDQQAPTANPYCLPSPIRPGIRLCGEYQSLPGIQWALLSGRKTAEAIIGGL